MKKSLVAFLLLSLIAACSSEKEKKGSLTDKKTELQKLKNDQVKLVESIRKLEEEIAKLDTSGGLKQLAKQIEVMTLSPVDFTHYIDLQGRIDAEDISYVTPRGMGGQVKAVYVKKGDAVRKGQLLLKLDDAILQQNLKQLQNQLDFAKNIFQRQKNLWDQGIGTEVQFLTAKNNVESLEKQMDVLKEQMSTSNVYAEVSGIADEVNIRVGEMFQGVTAAGPQIKIVNTSRLKAVVDIPENYLARVARGSKVVVNIPDLPLVVNGEIGLISQSINASSRGFTAEIKLPSNNKLKPNQIAQVKIQDYAASQIIAVPVNMVQSDEKGKYVYVMEKNGEKLIARRKTIITGESYEGSIEVKSGLVAGEQLVTEGYQTLYEGQLVAAVQK